MLLLVQAIVNGVIVGPFKRMADRRVERTLAQAGRLECAIRVVNGDIPGLRHRWTHGTAGARYQALQFRAQPLGLRVTPAAVEVDLTVWAASAERMRKPTLRETWTLNNGLMIATIITPWGTIELAAAPDALVNLIATITGAAPSPGD